MERHIFHRHCIALWMQPTTLVPLVGLNSYIREILLILGNYEVVQTVVMLTRTSIQEGGFPLFMLFPLHPEAEDRQGNTQVTSFDSDLEVVRTETILSQEVKKNVQIPEPHRTIRTNSRTFISGQIRRSSRLITSTISVYIYIYIYSS